MQVQLFDGWLAKYLGIWILFNCMLFQLVQGLIRSTDPICMSFQLSRTPHSASKAPTTASFCHACWELKNPAFFKGSAFYLSHGPQVFDPQPHACVSQLWPPAFFPVRVRQWLPSSTKRANQSEADGLSRLWQKRRWEKSMPSAQLAVEQELTTGLNSETQPFLIPLWGEGRFLVLNSRHIWRLNIHGKS